MTDFSDLIAARFGLPAKYGRERAAEGPLATILSRRSFRKYLDREVPVELINILLACAQSASAKSDLQQYSILHITEPALKARLGEISNTAWMATSPIVLVFCGDIHRSEKIAAMRGRDYAQNNLDSFMNAAVDAALAMQTFILAAESEGLGCCPISHIRNDLPELAELLALPAGVFPVCGVTAGWPTEERDVTLRLPPAVVVHENRYGDDGVAGEIDAYDQRRHGIRPLDQDRQLHADKYGKSEFYGWSESAARRVSQLEGLEKLRPFLERHGFALK